MARRRRFPQDHPPFSGLPVQYVTLAAGVRAAVHIAGVLSSGQLPILCIPGYQRNMSDFADFSRFFRGAGAGAAILVDLPGRGRADDRIKAEDYGSPADARDLVSVMAALGVSRAILLGQGYGGQVAMMVAAEHPLLVGGTVLLDSGPVADSRGIVRLRNNLAHVEGLRGSKAVRAGFRRMLAGDYPDVSEDRLEQLMGRTHFLDKKGRAQPLYDRRIMAPLKSINFDDVLEAQWPLYDALTCAPLLLMRTQLTDQVRRETFEEMTRRRPDVAAITIPGQGSPALFDRPEDIEVVARFVRALNRPASRRAA
jgi:pimeloyl-ACP methyl ester carboxylesterase